MAIVAACLPILRPLFTDTYINVIMHKMRRGEHSGREHGDTRISNPTSDIVALRADSRSTMELDKVDGLERPPRHEIYTV
ncbi:hypothetical protein BDV95DRAFT_575072 [Massariosphaeria phaeospora]|uniref:Uncharacterized protein n=1 Tax=Massariosphaeria phaeospora TaxID=100035 RepID=A0A7C8IBQ2_9PLEO|nr:hypothetical protein BDV95DRAFT_575072 [Massariosphaeria phaeospora]